MCGFIGILGPQNASVAQELYDGLLAVQHRGQDAAGITTYSDEFHTKKGYGLVIEVFNRHNMERLNGNIGIGHVRYPTVGTGREDDTQPFHTSRVAMAHNGNVTNYLELCSKLFPESGRRLHSSCDIEVILYYFEKALHANLDPNNLHKTPEIIFQAVKDVYDNVHGAYAVVCIIPGIGLLAFRGPYGIKPICVGRKYTKHGRWAAAASESVVLDINGYKEVRQLDAGEAILFTDNAEISKKIIWKPHRPCIFEFVYFARPDSEIDGISVYKTRRRFGAALAKQWKELKAPIPDVVIPIPDSSRDAALEMASYLGIPYREGLIKNRYIGRTFIMPNQECRNNSIRRKLNIIPSEFADKKVLLVDDSIVRGNTSKHIVRMAREAGAKEVYFGVTSPPLIAPCPYGIDMATKNEFIANGKSIENIATEIEVDFLMYLDRDAMNNCARQDKTCITEFCNACFTGRYPTDDLTAAHLALMSQERIQK